ncbi:hypothetical protein F4775DRAFT_588976 [Biscogniauxia sp. FL1348]|nr:hypothetical protein F4775DRAFT_588976 [Biscogniauxia sp. FL1348]
MTTRSGRQYGILTAERGPTMNGKRALENNEMSSNPPAKVRKVTNRSSDTPHLASKPATHQLQHDKDDPTEVNETGVDTVDEEGNREESMTEANSPGTAETTPNPPSSPTPITALCRHPGNSRPYYDSSRVGVYKRDDFTGQIRPRRMMDDMYANASKEKMKKYKHYHREYRSKNKTTLPEDSDDSEYDDDDSEDDSDRKGKDANEHDSGGDDDDA